MTGIGNPTAGPEHPPVTLAELLPGTQALVRNLDGVDDRWREHLQAYGLVPGRLVRLVQCSPVTVVEVEHTQLAFETHLGRGIQIVPIAAVARNAGEPAADESYGHRLVRAFRQALASVGQQR